MDKNIIFKDNCIYVIWYELLYGKHKNSAVYEYLEKSPDSLNRREFFSFLYENNEFDGILSLVDTLLNEKLDFHLLRFRQDMVHWLDRHLIQLLP